LAPVKNQHGEGYGWDYTEYCFRNGKWPYECIHDENLITNAATAITIFNEVTLPFNVAVTFYGNTTEVDKEINSAPSLGIFNKPEGATTVYKINAYSLIGTPHIGCEADYSPQGSSSIVFGICQKDLFSCYICEGPGCCFPVATGKN